MERETKSWLMEELKDLSLGDVRLNKRLLAIANNLLSHHQMPINQACGDWSSAKAAYRLFSNEKVTPDKILTPHKEETSNRLKRERVVLALQDTMYLNFTHHPGKKGVGPIGASEQNLSGFVVHGTLAITSEGLPLGRLTQEVWSREPTDKNKSKKRRNKPIEEKESYKWIKALRESVSRKPEGVELITIGDRESDIYELFLEAEKLDTYVLIRSGQNRQVEEELGLLWPHMDAQKRKKKIKIEIPAKDKTPSRIAKLEMRYEKVTINSSLHTRTNCDNEGIELTAIWLKEISVPSGVKEVRWMLLTNLPVSNSNEALKCVEWYKLRWQIEMYHKILKSGCNVEKCRLETGDRFARYFALMSIIAWRLFWMSFVNRTNGNLSCTVALTEVEWKALYCKIHKTKTFPEIIPSLYQAIRWIAQLGGFLGRKNDGEPGVMSLWRGWQRLNDIVETWSILHAP